MKINIKIEELLSLSMPIITHKSRTQIEFKSLEDFIEKENTVKFIEAFVEKLELEKPCFAKSMFKNRTTMFFYQTPLHKFNASILRHLFYTPNFYVL